MKREESEGKKRDEEWGRRTEMMEYEKRQRKIKDEQKKRKKEDGEK